tara:strand:- start:216 stop:530 length:315 start_codon:yes stop_codon:yes gene_type:complete
MKYISTALLFIFSTLSFAQDDSEWNAVAKQLKKKATVKVSNLNLPGYCNVFVELKHTKRYAIVVKVTSSGDYKICKASKSAIKKGEKYKYRTPEKYLRIHIAIE